VKRALLATAAFIYLVSCADLPVITPLNPMSPSDPAAGCRRVFPDGNWQFLHTVTAERSGGGQFVAMGLTVIASRQRKVRSMIMTVEGLVVFDAEYDGQLKVHRAFPPFDAAAFPAGLMDDIRLIFFKPEGPMSEFGASGDGSLVCRHRVTDGGTVDVTRRRDDAWELRRYGRERRLKRTVNGSAGKWNDSAFPKTITLTAHGRQDYTLRMTLVEAVATGP
jgi:hypothetical protein